MKSGAPGKLTVKVKKAKRAKGYRYKIGTNKAVTKNVVLKTSTKRTVTFKGLKRGTRYYVKVRAYRTVKGKKRWGKWSSKGSVLVRRSGKVAAFGDLAVEVQMVGGKDALAAADEELLAGGFQKVFADEGAEGVVAGWSGDGSAPSQMDADALVASDPDFVLVSGTGYSEKLTASQLGKLRKTGIEVKEMPEQTSTALIKRNVAAIAKMLSGSPALGEGWDPVVVSEQYCDFFDDTISRPRTNSVWRAPDRARLPRQ